MYEFNLERDRIKLNMKAFLIGEDLCVIISGGESPHIGCVTISVPRPSLSDASVVSATTSVLNLVGHKDDEVARVVSNDLSSKLNKTVVVTCGIHLDYITQEEINITIELIKEFTNKLIDSLL
jgi:gallate decarboxylase subunit D